MIKDQACLLLVYPHWENKVWFSLLKNVIIRSHYWCKGTRVFENTGPVRWGVWCSLVHGATSALTRTVEKIATNPQEAIKKDSKAFKRRNRERKKKLANDAKAAWLKQQEATARGHQGKWVRECKWTEEWTCHEEWH